MTSDIIVQVGTAQEPINPGFPRAVWHMHQTEARHAPTDLRVAVVRPLGTSGVFTREAEDRRLAVAVLQVVLQEIQACG